MPGEAKRVDIDTSCVLRKGTRNNVLNFAAFSLGQLVATGLLPERSVVEALSVAAR